MDSNKFRDAILFHIGTLFSALCFFSLIGLCLIVLLQTYIVTGQYRSCVVLPDGSRIGYESWIAPSEYLWQPNVVLKSPEGGTLVDFNIEPFYFSETSIYSRVYEGRRWKDIAYRKDAGVIYRAADPAIYQQLIDEAGPLPEEGRRVHNTNLLGAYFALRDSQAYGKYWCRLSFFPHMAK